MKQPEPVRRKQRKKSGWLGWSVSVVILAGLLCLLTAVAAYLFMTMSTEDGNPNLNPVERFYLQRRLNDQAVALQQPAGTGTEPVRFTVNLGESANVIANNLVLAGLLNDAQLFLDYARYYGLDSQLEAGDFRLSPQLTIPQLALALTDARPIDFTVSFIAGWRLEEMADSIATLQPANIRADEFLAIAQRQVPFDTSRYDFLRDLPPDASLEGYLYPDAYTLPLEATAVDLIDVMLTRFGEQVTPQLRETFAAQGLSLHDAVTLASITHREAVLADERPLIAGVYLNRLNIGMLLQADPTVQYAVGQPGNWWKNPLTLADLQYDSPYNTYVYSGLPPGPISSVGVNTLQAVANPTPSEYFFFVADCNAEVAGTHLFSVTYEEHLVKVQTCR